jgi:hypothetical protein
MTTYTAQTREVGGVWEHLNTVAAGEGGTGRPGAAVGRARHELTLP